MKKPASGVKWDLSDLYLGMTDPKIARDKEEIRRLAKGFTRRCQGRINSKNLTAPFLLQALKDSEKIWVKVYRYTSFASYLHSKNTGDEKIGKFYQKSGEFITDVSAKLLWFGLEWKDLPEKKARKLIADKNLERFKHSLAHARIFKPYTLSQKEEELWTKISLTGPEAFVRLYDQTASGQKYKLHVKGKLQELSYSKLLAFLNYHKDRKVRKAAGSALTKGLKENAKNYAFILNILLLDSKIADEIRGYKYPQEATFLSCELKPKTVETMVSAVERRDGICERFYKAKKKVLRYKKLYEWDRYCQVSPTVKSKYSWEEAKQIVLDSFKKFDQRFAGLAERFFSGKWIDAEITDGKIPGAYCSYSVPSHHPYVLLNFDGEIGSITALAHELGHGIHACLSRKQPLAEYWPSTPIAEIASVFSEMLVFDKLYANQKDPKVKADLLATKLQESFATIFRQTAFYFFESDIHKHRREQGELGLEEYGKYYQKRLQKMFGESLTLTKDHRHWWMPVLHFYHYDFYVFAYAFGELLTLALYAKYKKEGKGFIKKYLRALAMGGSKDPYEVTQIMGIKVDNKGCWDEGLDMLEGYVAEFENLTKKN